MRSYNLLALIPLAVSCLAAPGALRHVLHEKRSDSRHWVKRDRVHEDVKLPMRIGLTQSNLDRGDELLMEV